VIDVPSDRDDAPFWKVHPKLKAALSRIPRAAVFYERDPDGGLRWHGAWNPDHDPPVWQEESRSYCVFSASSTDERLTFATDTLEPDPDGVDRRVEGKYGRSSALPHQHRARQRRRTDYAVDELESRGAELARPLALAHGQHGP